MNYIHRGVRYGIPSATTEAMSSLLASSRARKARHFKDSSVSSVPLLQNKNISRQRCQSKSKNKIVWKGEMYRDGNTGSSSSVCFLSLPASGIFSS